jgi:hypothetical protein
MYPKLPSNFRIYTDRQSELYLKFNHELIQMHDNYLEKNPEIKPEVCWVYGNWPKNNDIYVRNWFGRTAFVIFLCNSVYVDYDIQVNIFYLCNINTNCFHLEECDFHIKDPISLFNLRKIAISCNVNQFEFSNQQIPVSRTAEWSRIIK